MLFLCRVHVDRKIIRERRCFQCGHGGLPVGSKPSEKNKATPLVGCMRCPKVYHLKTCLQLNEFVSCFLEDFLLVSFLPQHATKIMDVSMA
jgi:hypothetical protein